MSIRNLLQTTACEIWDSVSLSFCHVTSFLLFYYSRAYINFCSFPGVVCLFENWEEQNLLWNGFTMIIASWCHFQIWNGLRSWFCLQYYLADILFHTVRPCLYAFRLKPIYADGLQTHMCSSNYIYEIQFGKYTAQ